MKHRFISIGLIFQAVGAVMFLLFSLFSFFRLLSSGAQKELSICFFALVVFALVLFMATIKEIKEARKNDE